MPGALKDALKEQLDRSADEMVALVVRNIPDGPDKGGHIRDAVHKEAGKHDLSVVVVYGDAEHPYAAPLEFGHANGSKHTAPTPVFFPARRVVAKKHKRRMSRAARKAIKGIIGGGGK